MQLRDTLFISASLVLRIGGYRDGAVVPAGASDSGDHVAPPMAARRNLLGRLPSRLDWGVVGPDSYESQARLYVDTDAILTPLLRGLTIDTATASQLELMQRTLLSQPNLDRLISITDLNTQVKTPQERAGARFTSGAGRQADCRSAQSLHDPLC